MSYEITMAFSDYIPNDTLAEIADECFREIGAPQWDEEDYSLAKAYLDSYGETTKEGIKEEIALIYGEDQVRERFNRPLDPIVHPYDAKNTAYRSGSTDVGDVGYDVPTLNLHVATECIGNVRLTWQKIGQSASRIAYKGLIVAAKVMALAAIRTMDNQDVIKRAKQIVLKKNGGKYECPLPDSVKSPVGRY